MPLAALFFVAFFGVFDDSVSTIEQFAVMIMEV